MTWCTFKIYLDSWPISQRFWFNWSGVGTIFLKKISVSPPTTLHPVCNVPLVLNDYSFSNMPWHMLHSSWNSSWNVFPGTLNSHLPFIPLSNSLSLYSNATFPGKSAQISPGRFRASFFYVTTHCIEHELYYCCYPDWIKLLCLHVYVSSLGSKLLV